MQIKSVAVENFKALRDPGTVRLRPLSVIIGNNGSGKSSLLEAVETYRRVVLDGVDAAMEHWQGFEHVRHKAALSRLTTAARFDPSKQQGAMSFKLKLAMPRGDVDLSMKVNVREAGNRLYIQDERFKLGKRAEVARDTLGAVATSDEGRSVMLGLPDMGETVEALRSLLFLRLNSDAIGNLQSVKRSGGKVRLAGDGANVAEYLIDLRERSASAFEEVTRALQFVLPYASDVEPKVLDAGILRRSYVQLLEDRYEIPGWLMSSGSLRVLPLIATLLDPDPPPVLFIEEVENGLDPRTVGLVVDLMRAAAQGGRTQVIATTHSPYLLDMLDLDDVLLCERGEKGPAFSWPASRKEMKAWRDKFMPGRLYTMNALQREPAPHAKATPAATGEAPEGGWGDDE
jgi:predicted ATPase